ncbi:MULTISPECIES: cupin domain-containing protein [Streptomyces]|uniref:Cupin domain-containing protein n=3 Tax=Streptomyces rochei group TaxID=2867164 RepID=A0ABY6BM87_9ACTN|nr:MULTISPECIES: cupin domain-containing protein [Streptomyces]MBJ6617832.1 cupin domain-containing protein [Streptomyces sp. DHE17-7]MBQ0910881.1 cupin domain-containing protein [Streptomyces sp. RM99]MBU8547590.1 cupin domain-containing protein [Streptomyces sp. Osf17]MBU8554358.1 cupin domain-containing protein [Streptomyces sp. Babs14]MBX4174588.1 cupin domain-containing protein [Streptomyces geysiriensis]
MTAAPISLFSSFIHLDQDGRVHAAQPVFDAERDGWQLMTFHVETDADVHGDHWEIHTEADELVSCLAGGIRLYFRPEQPGAEEEEVRLAAGTATIVPRGRWHRIALDGPSDIMSVTLPRGSRLQKRTEA